MGKLPHSRSLKYSDLTAALSLDLRKAGRDKNCHARLLYHVLACATCPEKYKNISELFGREQGASYQKHDQSGVPEPQGYSDKYLRQRTYEVTNDLGRQIPADGSQT